MIFALTLVPVVGVVGVATDYSRALSTRAELQAALDAAALAVTRNAATMTPAQLQTAAETFFTGAFHGGGTPAPTITATYHPPTQVPLSNATVVVSGSVSVPMTFAGLFGSSSVTVGTSSTTTWGSTRLRVALALDNTGSMNSSGKIGALRTAATNLINQLQTAAQHNGDVYVSIIPFARVVDVGRSSVSASWIDWTGWEAPPPNSMPGSSVGPGSTCPYDTSSNSVTGYRCMNSPTHATSNAVDAIPSTGTYAGYICPGLDSGQYNTATKSNYYNGCYNSTVATTTCKNKKCTSTYTHTWIPNAHSSWDGAIEDRTQNEDVRNTTPFNTATNFPAIQSPADGTSLQSIVAPSYDWPALKQTITNMVAGGNTNQTIGLAWAWQSLTQNAPIYAPAKNANYVYSDVIILLSDGLNTRDRWYGNGSDVSPQVDARESLLCSNIWAANTPAHPIKIYTIQVNTGGDPTSTVLQTCGKDPATGTSYFYNLTSADQIISTFQTIGTQLSALRIAK